MNKKLKYLSIIPLYGTCVLFVYLFILSLKDKISKKKFFKSFFICAIVSAICWYMVMMIVYIVSEKLIRFDFNTIGLILTMIIGGYIINAFTFKYVDIKWNYLFYRNEEEGKSFLEVNKKKSILIGCFLAIVITILAIVTIIVLELI